MPIKINGTNTVANPSITGDDTDTGIVYGSDQIDFSTGGSSKVTLNGSNLGIGVANPSRKLHIANTSGQTIVELQRTNTNATGSTGTISFTALDGHSIGSISCVGDGDDNGGEITFRTTSAAADNDPYNAATPERMRIDSSGNVGIGTTSPSDNLEIAANHSQLRLTDTDDSKFVQFSYSGGKLITRNNSTSTTTAQFTLDESGHLGIGTTSPIARLHVHNAGTGSGDHAYAYFTTGDTGASTSDGLTIGVNAATNAVVHYRESGNLTFGTSDTERMRITNDGSVLIATTSTTVNSSNFGIVLGSDGSGGVFKNIGGSGDIFRVGGNAGLAVIYGDGDIKNTNNSYGQVSDETLKQDIVDAASQWNDIKNLKVRKFRFKDNPTGVLQIGVVAQEIETVSAGLVQEDSEGIKSVKYSVLYMKAVKALQEAIAKIETLETKVAALEAA